VDYEIDSSEIESIDELADYFVEQRTAINELELRMWHKIGEILSGKSETEIKQFIKLIKNIYRKLRLQLNSIINIPTLRTSNLIKELRGCH